MLKDALKGKGIQNQDFANRYWPKYSTKNLQSLFTNWWISEWKGGFLLFSNLAINAENA